MTKTRVKKSSEGTQVKRLKIRIEELRDINSVALDRNAYLSGEITKLKSLYEYALSRNSELIHQVSELRAKLSKEASLRTTLQPPTLINEYHEWLKNNKQSKTIEVLPKPKSFIASVIYKIYCWLEGIKN